MNVKKLLLLSVGGMLLCQGVNAGGIVRGGGIARRANVSRACDSRNNVRVLGHVAAHDAFVTAVPFAVPVAVPVATFDASGVLYSYRFHAQESRTETYAPSAAGTHAAEEPASDDIPERDLEIRVLALVRKSCLECHEGAGAKGGLDLREGLKRLTQGERLEIVERILSRDPQRAMPRGNHRLAEGEVRAFLRYLVR